MVISNKKVVKDISHIFTGYTLQKYHVMNIGYVM